MITAYRVEQVRSAEERAFARLDADGVGAGALMQRAAAGLASVVLADLRAHGSVYGARVLVLAGAGNNGGDGLYAGARLAARGVRVLACGVADRVHDDGWAALLAAGGRPVGVDEAESMITSSKLDVVVDAVLGIGGRGGLREPADRLARACVAARSTGAPRTIAVDVPSGVAADSGGVPEASLRADRTVAFGALKVCHLVEPARSRCGVVELVDIGLGEDLDAGSAPALRQWELPDLRAAWPVPGPRSDKYSRGVVGIDTGSDDYPGAAILSTLGAVHAGAGMVRFLGADRPAAMINQLLPNVVHAGGRVQSWLLGSGWGERPDGAEVVQRVLDTGLPMVLDADALRFVDQIGMGDDSEHRVLLTPHAGELARLLERERAEVEADPIGSVGDAANRTGATVLLKGATQLVAVPGNDTVTLALPGPAWTAQAGSGDTLAGICATLLAAGLAAHDAALAGASVQALAAARLPGPVPPQELAGSLAATGRAHGLWA